MVDFLEEHEGFMVGHVAPEAFVGGPIAFIKNGDKISINTEDNSINLEVSSDELENRKRNGRCQSQSMYQAH